MSPKVPPLETLLAINTLLFMPGLSASERQVAGVIIEHFNRTHGRCDPGVDRICKLLGLDRSTVLRALGSLHRRGVIRRVRHGGRLQRNRYEPNWELLRELHEAWNTCFRGSPDHRGEVAAAPPDRSQECHLGGGTAATQTYLENLLSKPDAVALAESPIHTRDRGKAASGQAGKGMAHSPAPTSQHHQTSRHAAEAAATRRWNADLFDRLRDAPEALACAIDRIDEKLQATATAAETRRHGAGVELILRSLQSAAVPCAGYRGAPGNPAAAGVSAPRVASSLTLKSKPKVEPKLKTKDTAQEPPTSDTTGSSQAPLPRAGDSSPGLVPVRLIKNQG